MPIHVYANAKCTDCDGTGRIEKTRKCTNCVNGMVSSTVRTTCDTCQGLGVVGPTVNKVKCTRCLGGNMGVVDPDCYICGGDGYIENTIPGGTCSTCSGKGYTKEEIVQKSCPNCDNGIQVYYENCEKCGGTGERTDAYTITYCVDGVTTGITPQVKEQGIALLLSSSEPVKRGYKFLGWSDEENSDVVYHPGDYYEKDEDIVLYAVWKELRTYTICYDTKSDESYFDNQTKYESVDCYISNIIPKKTGYMFLGWSVNDDDSVSYEAGDVYSEDSDLNLYAVWEKMKEFTIHYDANGGSMSGSEQIMYEGITNRITSKEPSRYMHVFLGWSLYPCGEICYNPSDLYEGNESITLYAIWNKKCSECEGRGIKYVIKCYYCEEILDSQTRCPKCGTYSWKYEYPTCRNCNGTGEIALDTHSYTETVVDATCVKKGTLTKECRVCGKTVKETIAINPNNHKEIICNKKDSTCTEKGYTGDIKCELCGKTISQGEEINATGHTYEETSHSPATYDKKGEIVQTCSTCGDVQIIYTEEQLELGKTTIISVVNNLDGIKLDWKKVSDATGYIVYRRDANGTWKKVKNISNGKCEYTDKNIVAGKTYYYKIQAYITVSNKNYYGKASEMTSIRSYTDTEAFVNRLYVKCLGRSPGKEEIKYWSDLLANKSKTGTEVASGFVFSQEYTKKRTSDEEYIKMLYQVFMNRTADAVGLNYWKDYLNQGLSREYVFKGFVESNEFKSICQNYGIECGHYTLTQARDKNPNLTKFVNRIYTKALNRAGEAGGLNYYCKAIQDKKMTPVQVAESFILSREFTDKGLNDTEYVKVLYRTFMGREADAGGLKYWLGLMNKGMTRKQVLEGFAGSNEFKKIVAGFGL